MLSALQAELQLYPTPYTYARIASWVSAMALAAILNERQGISRSNTLALCAICLPLSIVGSRLLDALEYLGSYGSFTEAIGRNGSSIYGGLALSFLAVWAYAAWRGVAVLRLLDAGGPSILLGESVSRVGCFLAGCCYGVPWNGPWAVTFPKESFAFGDQVARGLLAPTAEHTLAVHPVQLYSTVLAFLICLWLVRAFFRRRSDGEVFCRCLIGYGGLRLVMAPLRIESLGSMKFFSVAFIVAGTAGLVALHGMRRAERRVVTG